LEPIQLCDRMRAGSRCGSNTYHLDVVDGVQMRGKATMDAKQGVVDNSGQGKAVEGLDSGLIKGIGILSATYT
jgi:hypothetical protein